MAMLAEPKRKKKWSLNPRGKQWTNDETKIGQKLLEKMGWSKGMGLGREEQGELEPIRLKYKNDAEGVGYEAKDDQWVAHREEFNNILGLLNGNNGTADDLEKVPIKSLEDRSKSSKARVHYHKFTRGKDLSRYSATDLACILGKRAQVEHSEENTKIAEEETNEKNKIEHLHGVTTIQRGSYQEYFAAKMAEKQSQNAVNGVLKEQKESFERENEKRVRINEDLNIVKEFCSKEKIKNEKDTVVDETTGESLKKKKKKSKTKEFEIVTTDLPTVSEENLDIDTNKKKKKKTENADTELTESEPISKKKSKKRKIEEIVLNKAVENDGEAVPESNTKKKKKKSQTDEETSTLMGPDQSEINPQDASVEPVQNDGELNSKKKKKKKKKKEEVVLVNVQLSSDMSDPVTENGLKKSKKSNNSDNSFNVIPNGEAKSVEESPKKKKNDHDKEETPIVKDNVGEEVEVKKKSKKNKTKNIDDEQMHEEVVSDGQTSEKKKSKKNETKEKVETVEVAHQSEKKKSKKNKIAEVAVEQVDVEEVDGTQQSKKKKKKHKKEEEVVEKYTKIDDSFVEIAKHDQNLQSDQVEKIGIEAMQNVVSDDTQQSKKKKKKKKQVEETEEVKEVISNSEPSNGMDESFEEIRAYPNKRKRESISDSPNGIDVHLSKTSKKIEKNSEEPPTTPKIEKCASQGAPTINHVKIEKQDVEKSCPVEIKSELKESSVVDKTETTELNQPDSAKVKLPDIILKRKYRYKLDEVPFEKFVGSNLLSLSGYGDDHRFVT